MTEQYIPPYTSTPLAPTTEYTETTQYPVTEQDDSGTDSSRQDVAKEQAADFGHGAVEAGQHVGAVAKDQVGTVTAEAGHQAKDLLDQARSELTEQAGQQQQRLAAGLRSLGEELHAMTQHDADHGVATDLAKQASTKSSELAGWLDDREPGRLLDDVKTFARQRPAAFLLLAAGAGLLGGRLTRGIKDSGPDTQPSASNPTPDTEVVRPFASSDDGDVGFAVDDEYRTTGGSR